jgi:hypothetical protein
MGIMSLFVKVEEDGKEDKPASGSKSQPQSQPSCTGFQNLSQSYIPVSSSLGQEDAEIKKQLAAALEAANQPGYDYFEFAKSVDALASTLPGEALRFQSTFAVATSMGLSAEKLLSSAQFYLEVLKKKEDEFEGAVGKHSKDSIDTKEKSMLDMDSQMKTKSDQIQKLTEEINALQQQKTTTINEVTAAKAEIEKVRNNFSATMKIFTSRISGDIEKIKSYLTTGGKV